MDNSEIKSDDVVPIEENVEVAAAAAAAAPSEEVKEEEDADEMEAEDEHEGAADASGEAHVGAKRSADDESAAPEDGAAKKARRTEPVKLGYRTFHSCSQATEYFKKLLQTPALGTDFNEVGGRRDSIEGEQSRG